MFVTNITIENEIVKVSTPTRKVQQYLCKDNESAVYGVGVLIDLFAEDHKGNGVFHRDPDDITTALNFILNTLFLINTIETGNVNPLYGKSQVMNQGKAAKDRGNVMTAKQWLEDNPDNTFGIQKSARLANVNWAAMDRAMTELGRKQPSTRPDRPSKVAS